MPFHLAITRASDADAGVRLAGAVTGGPPVVGEAVVVGTAAGPWPARVVAVAPDGIVVRGLVEAPGPPVGAAVADTAAVKAALRDALRRRRAEVTPEAGGAAAAAATAAALLHPWVAGARAALVYVSVRRELDTGPLIAALRDRGVTVAVPNVDRGAIEARELVGALRPGRYGIPTSDGSAIDALDVAFVPGLAFAPDGARLGFGGGYYDRFLGARPALRAIGLAYRFQVLPWLPVEPHDVRVGDVIAG